MTVTDSHLILELTVREGSSIDEELTAAELLARNRACGDRRHGILVTRHNFSRFTVAVSPDVPFGETQERRLF